MVSRKRHRIARQTTQQHAPKGPSRGHGHHPYRPLQRRGEPGERTRAFGGEMLLAPAEGGGTRMEWRVPLSGER